MKKLILFLTVAVMIMISACSDNKAEKSSAAKTAKQITDKILDPINKAKAVKKQQQSKYKDIKDVE